jgi:glucan phosphoethanolaminetransferase (alkaline phosphatase superfamily)
MSLSSPWPGYPLPGHEQPEALSFSPYRWKTMAMAALCYVTAWAFSPWCFGWIAALLGIMSGAAVWAALYYTVQSIECWKARWRYREKDSKETRAH